MKLKLEVMECCDQIPSLMEALLSYKLRTDENLWLATPEGGRELKRHDAASEKKNPVNPFSLATDED
ncbi:hypothetical protein ABU178_19690 [Pantoea osteomyelitidis]|uniref:Uncharacterized protein n=1 Tax=Pantoea osteomyelitidis TaxID=3230026 RepID=A0ABW7Q1A5_9GAMM